MQVYYFVFTQLNGSELTLSVFNMHALGVGQNWLDLNQSSSLKCMPIHTLSLEVLLRKLWFSLSVKGNNLILICLDLILGLWLS